MPGFVPHISKRQAGLRKKNVIEVAVLFDDKTPSLEYNKSDKFYP
jgi:hypothetical protein